MMTDDDLYAISREHGLTASAHLDAASAHAKRTAEYIVDPDLCNEVCFREDEPAEPHLRAAALLGLVSLSERRSVAVAR